MAHEMERKCLPRENDKRRHGPGSMGLKISSGYGGGVAGGSSSGSAAESDHHSIS